MSAEPVAVLIVTYDSALDLPGCLAAVATLRYRPLELVVVDCGSSDSSLSIVRDASLPGIDRQILALGENRGFAGGMNTAFAATTAPYLLTLNPDARPAPDYIDRLLEAFRPGAEWRVGAATGRLVRPMHRGLRRIDACGMRLTRSWRHLDRGSGALDHGQWHQRERVFGATGAASLFSREAALDASLEGELFDPDFHSYREDAELCFRLQERGWEVIYEPSAIAEHRRRVLPQSRRKLPAAINYHSLKNRYLLRLYHQSRGNFWRTLLPALGRDLLALGYALLAEQTSLPAYSWLWRNRRRLLERRRLLRARIAAPEAVERWFGAEGLPADAKRS